MTDYNCLSCKWAFETDFDIVCDNVDSEYYQWSIVDDMDTCDRLEKYV